MLQSFITFAFTGISPGGLPHPDANGDAIQTVLQIVFGIVGALALLMITVSGLRYITSAGDPQKAASAKNGIVYAIVGLALAIGAQGIIALIVSRA